MQTFATARDAKEFLISRIVTEAQREGISLSDVERKMLYFSETAWTLPDIADVNDAFDRDYDQEKYEQKIAMLCRNFSADASKNNQDDFDSWKAAIRTLRREDHYLLVLIAAGKESSSAPRTGFLKLLLIGLSSLFWRS
jgi:hypothetical protein